MDFKLSFHLFIIFKFSSKKNTIFSCKDQNKSQIIFGKLKQCLFSTDKNFSDEMAASVELSLCVTFIKKIKSGKTFTS